MTRVPKGFFGLCGHSMMVRNTDFGRITELPRDLFIKGRAGFAFAFWVMTITGIGALQNHNWALPDPSAMQSNADLAHMKASTDPHSPVSGQLAAYSFQSSAVENSGDKAIRKNGSTDPALSTRQGNGHSGQGKSSLEFSKFHQGQVGRQHIPVFS